MSNVMGRREFLGGLAMTAMVPACGAPLSTRAAQVPGAPRAYPPLPPLGDDTFARRYDRLRALAREAGASVVFTTSGTTSFAFLVGGRVERRERLIALVVPV